MSLESASHITQFDPNQPDGLDDISGGDDHLRMIKQVMQNDLPLPGKFLRTLTKTGNYSVQVADYLSTIRVTATGVTISTAVAASVLGDGFMFLLVAQGFSVTFDPNGAETVNSLPSVVVPVNSTALITCDGTKFTAMFGAGISSGVGTAITGSVVLGNADVKQTRVITDGPSDVTLPPTNTVAVGDTVALKNLTFKRTRVLGNGTETIDGVLSPFTVPTYALVEFTCSALGQWIMSKAPPYYIGEVREFRANVVPLGWLIENAATYDTTLYGGLFSVIGTLYNRGDEPAGTFRVPSSAGRAIVGDGTGTLVTLWGPVNVDLTADTIGVPGDLTRWPTGLPVRFDLLSGISPTTVPAGVLVTAAVLYVINIGTTGFIKLATTLANAQAGTAINFTSVGTGSFSLTHQLAPRALGDYGGEEDHAQSSVEALQHNHGGSTGANTIATIGPNAAASQASGILHSVGQLQLNTSGSHQHSIANFGGNKAANVMQPFTVARFVIKA